MIPCRSVLQINAAIHLTVNYDFDFCSLKKASFQRLQKIKPLPGGSGSVCLIVNPEELFATHKHTHMLLMRSFTSFTKFESYWLFSFQQGQTKKGYLWQPFPVCEPGGIRIPNLLIRSQVHYPVMLRVLFVPQR